MRTKPTENVTTGALARILVLTAPVMAGTAGRAAAVEPDFDNVALTPLSCGVDEPAGDPLEELSHAILRFAEDG